MAADEGGGQAEFAAERAHLVLEQFAQRLDELHVHALGQAADIVVRLDRHRGAAGERDAFDHVGIERALRQELDGTAPVRGDLRRLRLERLDEQAADGLALRLGVGDAGERGEESVAGFDVDQRDVVVVAEQRARPPRPRPARIRPWSTKTQVSWSPIASWISTAATAESTPPDRPQITLPLPTCARIASLASRAERRHRPVALAAGESWTKLRDEPRAVGRVHDLGVELQAVVAAAPRRR